MRVYIERSDQIDNVQRTQAQRRAALIRTLLPVGFATLAIPFSFMNTGFATVILLIGVGFNFLNNAADLTDKFLIQPLRKII